MSIETKNYTTSDNCSSWNNVNVSVSSFKYVNSLERFQYNVFVVDTQCDIALLGTVTSMTQIHQTNQLHCIIITFASKLASKGVNKKVFKKDKQYK